MTTAASPLALPAPHAQPLHMRIAFGELGQREVAGDKDNPRILEYHQATTLPGPLVHDETAWCSSFANWCMREAGIVGTRKANARSWLDWGQRIVEPRFGCIVVFERGDNPSQGHVAFFVGDTARSIVVLGGNQGNAVSVAPYERVRWLGFRWLP